MTHTSGNRFKQNKNFKKLSKTSNGKFEGDYLSRIEDVPLPKVKADPKKSSGDISKIEKEKKIFSKSALGYTGDSIEVQD
jgi:hypothetical protein